MGQKVSPHGLRVGVIKDWGSKWYAGKNDFADFLIEDQQIRKFVKKKLYAAGISKVVVERSGENKVKVIISTGRPGMVIGRAGDGIDQLKADLVKLTNKTVDRRAMKQAIGRTMKANAKGIKVLVSGRLGGAEIARSESYSEGNVPLHTLRADIDYGFAEADTTYGKIGVKVWINHGEILDKGLQSVVREEKQDRKDGKRKNNKRRDGDRRPRRNPKDFKDEIPKAVNPRKRNTPKVEAVEPETEAPQVETQAVETTEE